MEKEILPRAANSGLSPVVFVGCAPYTWRYEKFFRGTGAEYVTTDINPSARVWGARRHVQCPIQNIDQYMPAGSVGLLFLNGVFGFGVDTEDAMNRALRSVRRVLSDGGLLLLGWNTDLIADPMGLGNARLFRHEGALGLPARKGFDGDTHVYDLLRPASGCLDTVG